MESEPLNSPSNEDEKLAALLRRSTPALPDDGFSNRVLAALPSKTKPSKTPTLATLLGTAGGVIGLIVALARGATIDGFGENFAQSFANSGAPLALASSELSIAVMIAALCLFFSYLLTKYSAEIF